MNLYSNFCGLNVSKVVPVADHASPGIGFKSVFMICETPMIFSNGYRIGFRDAASREAGVGYIVPEWKDSPTDDAEAAQGAVSRDHTVLEADQGAERCGQDRRRSGGLVEDHTHRTCLLHSYAQ